MGLYHFSYAKLNLEGVLVDCLVFKGRQKDLLSELIKSGYRVFYLRHSDNDWSEPMTIENFVQVNFYGYLAVKDSTGIKAIEKLLPPNNNNACIDLSDDDIRLDIIVEKNDRVIN